MSESRRAHILRVLTRAEGYLEIGLADKALAVLQEVEADPALRQERSLRFDWGLIKGESLRELGRFRDALAPLEEAAALDAKDVGVRLALGWCYKRTGQLPRAIDALLDAYRADPKNALIQYNLACYHTLARDKPKALEWLGRALRLDGNLRKLIPDERDFDPLRDDPDFRFIVDAGAAGVEDAPERPRRSEQDAD